MAVPPTNISYPTLFIAGEAGVAVPIAEPTVKNIVAANCFAARVGRQSSLIFTIRVSGFPLLRARSANGQSL
jgi:hypothetical protein